MEENNNNENQVKEVVKNETKKLAKKAIKPFMKYIVIGIAGLLAILLTIGLLLGVQLAIRNMFSSLLSDSSSKKPNSSSTSTNESESIIYIDDNGYYKWKEEDLAEKILQDLKDKKVNTEVLGLNSKEDDDEKDETDEKEEEEKLESLIKKYIKAEVQTTLPKTGKNFLGQNDVDGTIIIRRAFADEKEGNKLLRYVSAKEFDRMMADKNTDIYNCFSLDPDTFELWIAKNANTTTLYDFNGNVIKSISPDSEAVNGIVKDVIKYQKYVQSYSTPLNFFITLHLTSQNTDFMEELLDLILGKGKDEPLVLTYVDTLYEGSTQYDYSGKLMTTIRPLTSIDNNYQTIFGQVMTEEEFERYKEKVGGVQAINNTNFSKYYDTEYHKKVDTSYIGKLYITNADTWIQSSTTEIKGFEDKTPVDNEKSDIVKDEDLLPNNILEVTDSNTDGNTVKYKETRHITITEKVTSESTVKKYTLVDKENEINVDNFINLIEKYPDVENNITTSPSNIFYLLQQSENTQHLEKIMKYVIYKLSDIDYGYTDTNLEGIFTIKEAGNAGSIVVKIDEKNAAPILTKSELQKMIKKNFSGEQKKNLLNVIDDLMYIQDTYNVNAVFAIAFFEKESACGTKGNAINEPTYNWANIKGNYNGVSYIDDSGTEWRKYSSFNEATRDFGDYMANSEYYFQDKKYTTLSIGKIFVEKNHTEWVREVSYRMTELYDSVGIIISTGLGNEIQQKVIEVATNPYDYNVPTRSGYCQAYVAHVYYEAGANSWISSYDCALKSGYYWGASTDWEQIQLASCVYGYSSSIYGHVGIYIGDGMVAHNIGSLKIDDLDFWVRWYTGVCWGWNGGKDLTDTGSYPCIKGLIMYPNPYV